MRKIDSIYDLLISSVKIYESLGCNANCLLTLLAKMNDIFLKEAFRFFKHCAEAQVLCIWQYIIHLYLRYLVFYNYLSMYLYILLSLSATIVKNGVDICVLYGSDCHSPDSLDWPLRKRPFHPGS